MNKAKAAAANQNVSPLLVPPITSSLSSTTALSSSLQRALKLSRCQCYKLLFVRVMGILTVFFIIFCISYYRPPQPSRINCIIISQIQWKLLDKHVNIGDSQNRVSYTDTSYIDTILPPAPTCR